MKKQNQTKAQHRDTLLGRIVVGLWMTVFAWTVAIFFYVLVTERYFSERASGILQLIPWTMVTAAILLQSWRKHGKHHRSRFYQQLACWGFVWAAILFKSIFERV